MELTKTQKELEKIFEKDIFSITDLEFDTIRNEAAKLLRPTKKNNK